MDSMRKIHVVCPICMKSKRLMVPLEVFDNDQGSLLKLPMESGVVCNHRFVVVLDYHFSIRDYEVLSERDFAQFIAHSHKYSANDFQFF
jgi:hypothetical protein